MTKFGAAENKMKRLMAKFAQGTPTEYPLFFVANNKVFKFSLYLVTKCKLL